MHYKLLRISINDWKNQTSRSILDGLGRAKPILWSKYSTCGLTIKILRDGVPKRINDHLQRTLFKERRSQQVKFYDRSRIKIGKQSLGNRITDLFNEVSTPITFTETDHMIRTLLKKTFFAERYKPFSRVPTVVCFNGPGPPSTSGTATGIGQT